MGTKVQTHQVIKYRVLGKLQDQKENVNAMKLKKLKYSGLRRQSRAQSQKTEFAHQTAYECNVCLHILWVCVTIYIYNKMVWKSN